MAQLVEGLLPMTARRRELPYPITIAQVGIVRYPGEIVLRDQHRRPIFDNQRVFVAELAAQLQDLSTGLARGKHHRNTHFLQQLKQGFGRIAAVVIVIEQGAVEIRNHQIDPVTHAVTSRPRTLMMRRSESS